MSTSVRRPTGPHDNGSTGFARSQRPTSNIPVTVRKANLFTPQTKRPYSTGGASTAGKSFTSGMTTSKKYQRPLKPVSDRDQQMRMFDSLLDYLKVNARHLPLPDAKKFFSSVSTTESARIFEFLIGRIIPEFKVTRLETDVPEALAKLDYPYIRSVTKSALVSVTTRQAAAGLLFIFNWLLTNINRLEDGEIDEDEEPSDETNIICDSILLHPGREAEAIRKHFDHLYPHQDFQSRENELEKVHTEIEQLKSDLDDMDEFLIEQQVLREDIEKCSNYSKQMQVYLQARKNELEQLNQQTLEMENEELARRIERISLQIREHELDPEEVRRNKALLESKELELTKLRQESDAPRLDRDELCKTRKRLLAKLREKDEEEQAEKTSKCAVDGKEEDRQFILLQQRLTALITASRKEEEQELLRLKTEKDEVAVNGDLREKYLKTALERRCQQAAHIVEIIERENERWQEALEVAEGNNKVAKAAAKLFKNKSIAL